MIINEKAMNASGKIVFGFRRNDVKITSNDVIFTSFERNNVITCSGADIMARLLGGDMEYVPRHIGFMYGADSIASTLVDPDLIPEAARRIHPWSLITQDTADATANILIAPLVLSPGYAAESTNYAGNTITVSAFTGVSVEYAFPTTGSIYATNMPDLEVAGPLYFYQALFLNRRTVGSQTIYTPFSRVTLRNPTTGLYDQKPSGFEAALYWTICFS